MKYLEQFNSFEDISIEILDYNFKGFPLLENLNTYEYKENGQKINIPLSEKDKIKLKKIKNNIDIRLSEINSFEGKYINEHGHVIKRIYDIIYNNHWLIRFLRKDMEDPDGIKGIEEPSVFEGVDLIYKNRNRITELVHNKILQDEFKVLAKAKTSTYELIFEIEKERLEKKKYRIYFITQMKGSGHNFKHYNPNKKPINRNIKLQS